MKMKMTEGGPSQTLCEDLLAELTNSGHPLMRPPTRPATKEELELLCRVFSLDPDELTDGRQAIR